MSQHKDEVILRFRPLRDAVPLPNRVRQLLKYALRTCKLKCERVEALPQTEPTVETETKR